MSSKGYNYIRKTFLYDGQRYEVRGKTEEEAVLNKAELIKKLENGIPVKQRSSKEQKEITGDITVNDYAEIWLKTYIEPKIREIGTSKQRSTMSEKNYNMYVQQLNNHILPVIGKMQMKKVRDSNLQGILNQQKKDGRSYSTSTKTRIVLNAMFAQAAKSRIIQYNTAADLTVSCEKGESRRSLTEYEKEILLKAANKNDCWYGLWIKFLMYSGLRPAESAALQVKDLDFKKNLIRVNKAIESGTENIIGEPKTEAGNRMVPINVLILDELKASIKDKGPEDFVFTQKDGKTMMTSTSMNKCWKAFRSRMNIAAGAKTKYGHPVEQLIDENICLYCLRHTYGSDLQRAGVPLNEAKVLMGHSDVSTTANIYTHTNEDDIIKIGEKLNAFATSAESKSKAKKASSM